MNGCSMTPCKVIRRSLPVLIGSAMPGPWSILSSNTGRPTPGKLSVSIPPERGDPKQPRLCWRGMDGPGMLVKSELGPQCGGSTLPPDTLLRRPPGTGRRSSHQALRPRERGSAWRSPVTERGSAECCLWLVGPDPPVSILTSPAAKLPCLAVSSTSATEGSQWHEAVIAPKPRHGMSTTLCHKGESFSDAYAVRRPREPAIAKHTFSITRSSSWAPSSVQGVCSGCVYISCMAYHVLSQPPDYAKLLPFSLASI